MAAFSVRIVFFSWLITSNREVKFDVYDKRQKQNFCLLSSALCTVESKYLHLQGIVRDTFLFLYDLFKDNMKRIEKQRKDLPFAFCRKRQA